MLDLYDRRQVVIRYLLEDAAAEDPDATCVAFADGTGWTWSQALSEASAAAHQLLAVGLAQGDSVAIALPNGADYLRAWWGSAMMGAIVVPVNTAHRGPLLHHLLDLARPTVVVTSEEFLAHVGEVATSLGCHVVTPGELRGPDRGLPSLQRPIEPWDPISHALTSGSTGPSKLVRVTHAHSMAAGRVNFELMDIGQDDTYLADIPMVHVSALYFVHAALRYRTRIAVRPRPSLDDYWEVARDCGATVSQLYSTMVTYLEGKPVRAAERQHRLRVVVTVPLPADPPGFASRFGITQLAIGYGSTEVSCPIAASPKDPLPAGSTGRLLPGWEVRLVDIHDLEVPEGDPGEAIVRSAHPWLITTEYVGNPRATAEAWRNGWFHTGDLLRRDAHGNYVFVDRIKDAIRRRGQNISSYEVEAVLRSYPGISDAAVVAERSAVEAEDEVKAWLTLSSGATVDFADLLRFTADRLAHFMVPRYFEVTEAFPRTASAKVMKQELRDRGTTHRTWDRIANGLDVTRRGVESIDSSTMG